MMAAVNNGHRSGGSRRILIVDDNALNRMLAQKLLEAAGYAVDSVEDGPSAVGAVQDQDFGLVLMDIMMPDMDGIETTRRIRALGGRPGAIPVVALTAAPIEDLNGYDTAGFDGYIGKPIQSKLFASQIARWIPAPAVTAGPEPAAGLDWLNLPIIETDNLGRLESMLSADELSHLLETFYDGACARLDRIIRLAAHADLPGLAREAHDLKSTAGSLGALRLAKLADQLHIASRSGNTGMIDGTVNDIRSTSSETWKRMAEHFGTRWPGGAAQPA